VQRYVIDHDHSNAFTAWQNMGTPAQPTPEQYASGKRPASSPRLDRPKPSKSERAAANRAAQAPAPSRRTARARMERRKPMTGTIHSRKPDAQFARVKLGGYMPIIAALAIP